MMVAFWIGLSVVVGALASARGRNGGGWFVLSLCISPVIAGLLVMVFPRQTDVLAEREIDAGVSRKCPMCAELVRIEARRCRHCGADLTPPVVEDPPPPPADKYRGNAKKGLFYIAVIVAISACLIWLAFFLQ